VRWERAGLLTDLYELTMLQAYWEEGMEKVAVFSLYYRSLPQERNLLLACGLDDGLAYLERLRFDRGSLDYLATVELVAALFLRWLEGLRFRGDVWALPEGTPFFPDEPLLEVVAPIPRAQVVESFLMNQLHLQAVLASEAVRVVTAAEGRAVVDFGMRRMRGADAGPGAARAFHVAGVAATGNVPAGKLYGIPVTGTVAHSYVQAHDRGKNALWAFAEIYGDTVLLVDTDDTLNGVPKVIALAQEMGESSRVRAVRLDSGTSGSWPGPRGPCSRRRGSRRWRSSPAAASTSTRSRSWWRRTLPSPASGWAPGWGCRGTFRRWTWHTSSPPTAARAGSSCRRASGSCPGANRCSWWRRMAWRCGTCSGGLRRSSRDAVSWRK
jgi:hypothetical protein